MPSEISASVDPATCGRPATQREAPRRQRSRSARTRRSVSHPPRPPVCLCGLPGRSVALLAPAGPRGSGWWDVVTASAGVAARSGGLGCARPISVAGGSAQVRCPRREHHIPARWRGRQPPCEGAPAATAWAGSTRWPRSAPNRLATGYPSGHGPGRSGAGCGPRRRVDRHGGRGRETRVCSVLRWMDGRIHEASPARFTCTDSGTRWPDCTTTPTRGGRQLVSCASSGTTRPSSATSWSTAAPRPPVLGAAARRGSCPLRGGGCEWPTSSTSAGDAGLIHADLHLGNALFQRGEVKLIDFDDCGTGPRLYELAVALWELRDRPDYPAYRDALLAGYSAPRDRRQLPGRLHRGAAGRLRPLVHRHGAGQPGVRERLDRVHRWSLSMLGLVAEA